MTLPAAIQVIASRALTADQLHSAGDDAKALTIAMAVCRSDVPELVAQIRHYIARTVTLNGRVANLERQIAELRSGKDGTAAFARGESHG